MMEATGFVDYMTRVGGSLTCSGRGVSVLIGACGQKEEKSTREHERTEANRPNQIIMTNNRSLQSFSLFFSLNKLPHVMSNEKYLLTDLNTVKK